ncbi:pimeloyl-ACP methyl ester carboxylesterase [Streptomyces filamentosus]
MLPWKSLVRALSVLLLTIAAVLAPTAAAQAAAPSRGWNDWTCKPSAAHPRPVVLVHGTFGNSVDNWLALAPYLVNRGYCVYSLDYGQLPNVPLFHGLGPIEKSAGQLDAFVDRVLAATGAPEADLVGHSQGGMMPRWYLKFLGGAEKVNALVGIAPDNHGTTLLGLTKLLPYFPGAEDLLTASTPGLADQIAGSAFLTKLKRGRRHRARRPLPRHRDPVRRGRHAVPLPVPDRTRRHQRPHPGQVRPRPLRARGHRPHGPGRLPRGRQRPRPGPRHPDQLPLGGRLAPRPAGRATG